MNAWFNGARGVTTVALGAPIVWRLALGSRLVLHAAAEMLEWLDRTIGPKAADKGADG